MSCLALAIVVALMLGCRKESPVVRADDPKPVDASVDVRDVAPEVVDTLVEPVPPPTHTALRTRFTTIALKQADHGIDGTLELWRDKRIDDKVVTAQWYHRFEDVTPKGFEKPAPAQLLRDDGGKVLALVELGSPLVKLEPIRLGDEPVPHFEVSIDTYHGAHHWDGTTHRFGRVEAGHLKWLECAACTDSALAGQHWFDPRPSGGNDLLWYRHDVATQTTLLARTQVVAGTCRATRKTVPGWLGDYGSPPAPKTHDFPPRL